MFSEYQRCTDKSMPISVCTCAVNSPPTAPNLAGLSLFFVTFQTKKKQRYLLKSESVFYFEVLDYHSDGDTRVSSVSQTFPVKLEVSCTSSPNFLPRIHLEAINHNSSHSGKKKKNFSSSINNWDLFAQARIWSERCLDLENLRVTLSGQPVTDVTLTKVKEGWSVTGLSAVTWQWVSWIPQETSQ